VSGQQSAVVNLTKDRKSSETLTTVQTRCYRTTRDILGQRLWPLTLLF